MKTGGTFYDEFYLLIFSWRKKNRFVYFILNVWIPSQFFFSCPINTCPIGCGYCNVPAFVRRTRDHDLKLCFIFLSIELKNSLLVLRKVYFEDMISIKIFHENTFVVRIEALFCLITTPIWNNLQFSMHEWTRSMNKNGIFFFTQTNQFTNFSKKCKWNKYRDRLWSLAFGQRFFRTFVWRFFFHGFQV